MGDILAHGLGSLLDDFLTLGQDQLDVARVRHVRVDATVGAVSASPLLGGLVDLDVLDDQVGGIETLGVGVGLGVLEETEQELSRLDGPAGLGDTERLAYGCCVSANPFIRSICRDIVWRMVVDGRRSVFFR